MKYLVVLNAESATGKMFAKDFDFMMGAHPVLACSEIEIDSPYYIFAKRQPKGDRPHQSLFLPHGSVVLMHRYDELSDPSPFGFATR